MILKFKPEKLLLKFVTENKIMGFPISEPKNTKHLSFTGMNLDVRDKTLVYVVFRREPKPNNQKADYFFQGVAAASGDKTAEEVAMAMCRDNTYFIFPATVNVALPHKPVVVSGLYFPLNNDADIT